LDLINGRNVDYGYGFREAKEAVGLSTPALSWLTAASLGSELTIALSLLRGV